MLKFLKKRKANIIAEYAILAGIIALLSAIAVAGVGVGTRDVFTDLSQTRENVAPPNPGGPGQPTPDGAKNPGANFAIFISEGNPVQGDLQEPYFFDFKNNLVLTDPGEVEPEDIFWRIVSGSLPVGMSIDGFSGIVFGSPEEEGDFAFTIRAEFGSVGFERAVSLRIGAPTAAGIYPASMSLQGSDVFGMLHRQGDSVLFGPGAGSLVIAYDRARTVDLVNVRHARLGQESYVLELAYLDGAGNWVPLTTFTSPTDSSLVEDVRQIGPVTASQFRLSHVGGPGFADLASVRLGFGQTGSGGVGSGLPAFLPELGPITDIFTVQGVAFNRSLLQSAINTQVAGRQFEFTPTTWNGLSLNADGSISGTPTGVVTTPFQVSVRVTDNRSFWSNTRTFSIRTDAAVTLGGLYPDTVLFDSTDVLRETHTRIDSHVDLTQNDTPIVYVYGSDVQLNNLDIAFGRLDASGTATLVVERRDLATNQWVEWTRISRTGGVSTTSHSLATSSVRELRIRAEGASSRIVHARFGMNSAFPAFLPRLGAVGDRTLRQNVSVNQTVSGSAMDLVGSGVYEFTPSSWNGLTLGSNGNITGAPTNTVLEPQTFTVRVRDNRGFWSLPQTFTMTAQPAAAAIFIPEVTFNGADVRQDVHTRVERTLTVAPGESVLYDFGQLVRIDALDMAASTTGSASVVLEYRQDTSSAWAMRTTITSLAPGGTGINNVASSAVQQARIRNAGQNPVTLTYARFGGIQTNGSFLYPEFLPRLTAIADRILQRNVSTSSSVGGSAADLIGSGIYEFTPLSWNGLTLGSNGTISGIPTASGSIEVTARVRDSRNFWSLPRTFTITVN